MSASSTPTHTQSIKPPSPSTNAANEKNKKKDETTFHIVNGERVSLCILCVCCAAAARRRKGRRRTGSSKKIKIKIKEPWPNIDHARLLIFASRPPPSLQFVIRS